ncbi:MAG: hypothetical protein D4R65_10835 [Verrucomicrobiaceae bacterium]|nr:MAG: hypothetical protein D4R65_10835 [Verrucomicrobiaceae bacterium]
MMLQISRSKHLQFQRTTVGETEKLDRMPTGTKDFRTILSAIKKEYPAWASWVIFPQNLSPAVRNRCSGPNASAPRIHASACVNIKQIAPMR